jgi:hypothetical protein
MIDLDDADFLDDQDENRPATRPNATRRGTHAGWTEKLIASADFAGGEACWDAVDPSGSREPTIARTYQLPENVTAEAAGHLLSALVRVWLPKPQVPNEERVPFAYALIGFQYDPMDTPSPERVLEAKRHYNKVRSMLSSLMLVFDLQSRSTHDPTFFRGTGSKFGTTTLHAFHQLAVVLKLSKGLVINDLRYRSLYGPQASTMLSRYASPWEDFIPSVNGSNLLSSASEDSWGGNGGRGGRGQSRTRRSDPKELEPHQQIIMGVLQDLRKNCYSIMDGDAEGRVWKQVLTPDSMPTHAWRPVCPMLDYVREWAKPVDNHNRWQLLTKSSWTVERIASHLLTQPFDQFLPRRKMCRTAWSFRNGVYYGEKNEFMEYMADEVPDDLVSCK